MPSSPLICACNLGIHDALYSEDIYEKGLVSVSTMSILLDI